MPEVKTGRRLVLNDGTTIENGDAGYSSGYLWMWVPDMTMQEAAKTFLDPEKTKKVIFEYGEMADTYEGYTACTHLSVTDGKVTICLTKGAGNNV